LRDRGIEQSILAQNTFVGRERELAELVSACEAGADSDAHLFLIYGEPGIGKTRLADELASRAKARGMQVLWGRCWEGDGAPAYWPWIQIIRGFLAALAPERRTLALESEAEADMIDQVAQIVPDLRRAQSALDSAGKDKLDVNDARFRLFDAVTSFLKFCARAHPMLIVFDDLHDADEASLAMLRFMARELKAAPIMIVATFRDLEVRRSPALSKVVGELSREAHSIPLGSLSRSEVSRFVEIMMGRAPDEALVAKLWATTNGNPLFVDGVVRTLIAEGAVGSAGDVDRQFRIPGGVREAIRTRLATLSAEANSILTWAAAIGNEFELSLCRSAANASAEEANRLLDEAAGAGIVRPLGGGRYRFCHALIRDSVYDELDTSSRIATHRKIGELMEELYRADIDAHLAELAHHFREANVGKKAIDYSVRAGKAAAVFAVSDAAMHWRPRWC
jgi:predicted ATPase